MVVGLAIIHMVLKDPILLYVQTKHIRSYSSDDHRAINHLSFIMIELSYPI